MSQMSVIYFGYTAYDTIMMGRYANYKDKLLSMPSKRCESEPNKGVVVVDDFRSYGEATLAFYSKL